VVPYSVTGNCKNYRATWLHLYSQSHHCILAGAEVCVWHIPVIMGMGHVIKRNRHSCTTSAPQVQKEMLTRIYQNVQQCFGTWRVSRVMPAGRPLADWRLTAPVVHSGYLSLSFSVHVALDGPPYNTRTMPSACSQSSAYLLQFGNRNH